MSRQHEKERMASKVDKYYCTKGRGKRKGFIIIRNLDYYLTIICLVLQVLCMLCCWVEDPSSDPFKLHVARIPDYLWVAEDGMKMQVKEKSYKLSIYGFDVGKSTIILFSLACDK